MTRLLIRRDGDNNWRTPEVTAYDNEAALQRLLAESPHLLPGINDGEPVATAIEFPVPDTGSADLVCVNSEGQITIVECKLSGNEDIKRRVVGQVFAYAAGISSMDFEQFESAFTRSAEQPLMGRLGGDTTDTEPVRAAISDNLAAGRFRLIIAVDEITPELQRVVRYLNQHTTSDVDLLAIELRYIKHSDVEILVPEVYGEEIAQQKAGSVRRNWNEASLFDAFEQLCSAEGVGIARRLFTFLQDRAVELRWGVGKMPSVTIRLPIDGQPVSVITMYAWEGSQGFVQIKFEYLADSGVSREKLFQMVEQLREIPGTGPLLDGVVDADFKKHPMFRIEPVLTRPGAADVFESAISELMSSED